MKHIQHILTTWAAQQGCNSVVEAAKKAGFKKSTFGDWWRGVSVPRRREDRSRLFEITGNAIFQGELTAEMKALALAEYVADPEMATRCHRLVQLIKAITPDLCAVVQHGTLTDRDTVRTALTSDELVNFSTLARALSSEDARKLLEKERSATKGGRS